MPYRAAAVALTALAGCASVHTGAQKVADGKKQLAEATVCCTTLEQARRRALPVEKEDLVIDGTQQAIDLGTGKTFFALYELPQFVQTYAIAITSIPTGPLSDMALLVPRVTLYDAKFTVTRYFDEKTLRNRGNQLERTIFINPQNAAERYLVISAADLSSSIETPYSMVTSTPIVAGPVVFNLVSGQDGKTTLRASPIGQILLEVQGAKAPVK